MEFLSKIPYEKFKRFEVSLSNFRDKGNPYEEEREKERSIFGINDFIWPTYMKSIIFCTIYYMHIIYLISIIYPVNAFWH